MTDNKRGQRANASPQDNTDNGTILQQAARRYARAGYPVLRVWGLNGKACRCPKGAKCPAPGKHPVETAWQRTATTNPAKGAAMFPKDSRDHLGIMPPKECVWIDIDPRNGGIESMKKLLNGKKLPRTVEQRSGGGGMHGLYRGDCDGTLGDGIDIKLPGRGFVVAYPSGHISGGKYEWVKDHAPWDVGEIPMVPKELRSGQQDGKKPDGNALYKDGKPPKAVPIEKMRGALEHVPGDDYHRWINIGHALKHAYEDDGEALWLEWSKTSSKYKAGDEQKWETFDHNRDRPLITIRSIMSIARRNGYRPLTSEFSESLWALADVSGKLKTKAKPRDWVFDPCFPLGRVTVVAGAGGSSKSFFMETLGTHLACGEQFGPFKPPIAGKALMLVAEENDHDIHLRLDVLKGHKGFDEAAISENFGVLSVRGLDWRLLVHDAAGDLQESDRVEYLIDEVKAAGVRLLVLDPLVAFNGATENDNVEMARLMFTLDRIAEETGAAVVVIHHVSKGGQVNSMNDVTQAVVRGASAIVDNSRAVLVLTRIPRGDAHNYGIPAEQAGRYVVMRVVKNNYGKHVPDAVFAVEAGGALRYAPEITRRKKDDFAIAGVKSEYADVLRHLAEQPGSTAQTIHKKKFPKLALRTVQRYLEDMQEKKWIESHGLGKETAYRLTKGGEQTHEELIIRDE